VPLEPRTLGLAEAEDESNLDSEWEMACAVNHSGVGRDWDQYGELTPLDLIQEVRSVVGSSDADPE